MPRALIASDKFKGSLSAIEACQAIVRGMGEGWTYDLCPIADGGEGFTEAVVTAAHGTWVDCSSHDALGREIAARYGIIEMHQKKTAVMEMAAAAGYALIAASDRNIMLSNTYGVGEMLRHAVEVMGVETIIIGIGGSATNDGGAGMAAALGVKFFDEEGNSIEPSPHDLTNVSSIDRSSLIPLPQIMVACDVTNPLCGPHGASYVYGPQKGADQQSVAILDSMLEQLAICSGQKAMADIPGAGAAGGLGFGLMAFANATLVSGFSLVADMLDIKSRIAAADVVITGEGCLDEQSVCGKGPCGIASMAKSMGKRTIGLAGKITQHQLLEPYFDYLDDISSLGYETSECMSQAAILLERIAKKAGERML